MMMVPIMRTVSRILKPRFVFMLIILTFVVLYAVEDVIETNKHTYNAEEARRYFGNNELRERHTRDANYSEMKMLMPQIVSRLSRTAMEVTAKLREIGIQKSVLDTGYVNMGTRESLVAMLAEAVLKGRRIKIGVLGASVSAGAAVNGTKYIYANVFAKMLSELLDVSVEVHNGAIGGCDSQYYCYCAPTHAAIWDMDIILLEFGANDQIQAAVWQERLVRKLLTLPKRPQLIYVNFILGFQMETCVNAESEEITPVSKRYGIPSVSFRNIACHKEMMDGYKVIFSSSDDYNHPGKKGHHMVAIFLIQMVAGDLINVCKQIGESEALTDPEIWKGRRYGSYDELPEALWDGGDAGWTSQCWSTQRPITNREHDFLQPVFNDGWSFQVPSGQARRNDEKSSWFTKRQDKTIIFPVYVDPQNDGTECNITLVTLTCPSCGKAEMYLDRQEDVYPVNSNGMFRLPHYNHIPNVAPGNHNVTVISSSDEQILVAGIVTICLELS
ncbi:uncharacterized protein LOC144348609 [Saccoglossus kowalevskii]